MPPKAKFTREEIITAGFNSVKREGREALTARSLAEELGSSPRPIFSVFNNMEEVQSSVVCAAKNLYAEYIGEGLNEELAFRGVGKAYVRFAYEQPKLFQLLFMSENGSVPDTDSVLGLIDDSFEKILNSIESEYGLEREISKKLYLHLWIYSHGIAVLVATRVCAFSSKEITAMITEIFLSLLKRLKSEGDI